MNIILRPWRLYADFNGRSRRSEYFVFILIRYGILAAVFLVSDITSSASASPQAASMMTIALLVIAFLASIVPGWAVTVRRLHDQGKSFKWLFLTFVPYVGVVAALVFGLWPGEKFENEYGTDPRQFEDISIEDVGAVFE